MEPKIESGLPRKTVKKIVKTIEKNIESHIVGIDLFDEILRKYEEENKTSPPKSELTMQMRQIFLDLITMMKRLDESHIQFNKKIIKMLEQK